MNARSLALLLAVMVSPQASGQLAPPLAVGDPRIQSIDYYPDQVVRLQAATGYQLTIELAPDERVENVALGDSGAWQVSADKRGNHLFLKSVRSGVDTNMVVLTDNHSYSFDLVSLSEPGPSTPYIVRFRYPSQPLSAPADASIPEAQLGRYKLRGNRQLQPAGMHDDGIHTYVEWPVDRALPAIYAVDGKGRESLVNGMVRDNRIVIDSVQRKLVFRIDNLSATATRATGKR
jgi:type IV secretion system protein VirB9